MPSEYRVASCYILSVKGLATHFQGRPGLPPRLPRAGGGCRSQAERAFAWGVGRMGRETGTQDL